jgi:ATP-dependent DNA ligase
MPRGLSPSSPAGGLPADLTGPVTVQLTRTVDAIPGPHAMSGGCAYEVKWDGYRAIIVRSPASQRS